MLSSCSQVLRLSFCIELLIGAHRVIIDIISDIKEYLLIDGESRGYKNFKIRLHSLELSGWY